ncbi:MAG: response regulator transcription factor [Nitrospinales bacterium]
MKKIRISSNRIKFYIVGKRRLENELIASYLKRKKGNECFVLEDINHIPKGNPNNNGEMRLVLWDCQKKDLKSLLTELRTYNIHKPYANHIVLFNVPTGMEFNRKLVIEGIQGFFYEHDSLDNFIKGVQTVIEGKLWLSREMMTKCIFEEAYNNRPLESIIDNLTERQIEILATIAVGATNEEIAYKLCISPHTVKTHLYRIYKKINVPNRIQAALWTAKNL